MHRFPKDEKENAFLLTVQRHLAGSEKETVSLFASTGIAVLLSGPIKTRLSLGISAPIYFLSKINI
jgi:hypothetical protein